MSHVYPVPAMVAATAKIDRATYQREYARSVEDSTAYWSEVGRVVD